MKYKTIRATTNIKKIEAYLKLKNCLNGIESNNLADDIFRYALNIIRSNNFDFEKFDILDDMGNRPKTFFLSDETYDFFISQFNIIRNNQEKKFFKYQFVELIYYLYALDNIEFNALEDMHIDWIIEKKSYL